MSNNTLTARPRPNSDTCRSSTFARAKALQAALGSIRSAPRALLEACKSVSALAALDIPSIGITPFASRNTLFKYADLVLADLKAPTGTAGWGYLDWLRREVRQLADKNVDSRSKSAREARKNKRQEETSNKLYATIACMTKQSKAYLRLLQEVSALANSDAIEARTRQRLLNVLNDHDELYGELFSPEIVGEMPSASVAEFRQT